MDYNKLIENFDNNNPILEFIKKGIKPEDIKEAVLKSLRPYFKDENALNALAMNQLIGGWLNFELFKRDAWYFDKFEKCLNLFNEAFDNDKQKCISAIVDYLPEISQSISRYWSFLKLEVDKNGLEIDEYLEENLKNIGQLLEGIIKTYLKLLLHITLIKLDKPINQNQIKLMDLGAIIDVLIKKTDFPELFQPVPWNLRLYQWRNIAYHHSAVIENDKIKCWYKKNLSTFGLPFDFNTYAFMV